MKELIDSGKLDTVAHKAIEKKLAKVTAVVDAFGEDEDDEDDEGPVGGKTQLEKKDEGPGAGGGKTQREKEDDLVASLAALGFEDAGRIKDKLLADKLLAERGPEKLSKGAAEEE